MRVQKGKITKFQRKLVELMVKNPEITWEEAGRKAGSKSYRPDNSAFAAMKNPNVQQHFREIMEKFPELQDSALAEKVAKGTKSKMIKFFAHEGRVVETKVIADTRLQKDYVELALKLKGLPALKVEMTGEDGTPLTVNIVKYSSLKEKSE